MPSALEKARQDPNSMKARILAAARRIFGEYGYSETTTRRIAKNVGIDISTLYYHWGEKQDLYEAVLQDVSEEIQSRLNQVEKTVSGKPLKDRLEVSIDMMCDYLFSHPEVSNLILFGYFSKTRHGVTMDIKIPQYISNIALAMELAADKKTVTVEDKARILAVWNTVLNFISGEDFFRPMLKTNHENYVNVVKETLKFILVPAFTLDQQ
ncbi:MAG: TetR/AcrR family transcriptional regulator [Desulfobacterales bacterium]|jgi:AcrR family transcriptional regulator|nr:TetR/AcrR family transcriptional regulator [Desulfobacterales bacterium]MDH3826147.1 TetR/AcrR family transcriptional regulator [Desulfobacterales bacterium]MDH3877284.1 TetR/AcrR family transcriptional regulator [Desulfobacterales bacterium]MDH4009552.1 TetR/AcrR family transcriptional regulator [Desulfobacterales bacterium]